MADLSSGPIGQLVTPMGPDELLVARIFATSASFSNAGAAVGGAAGDTFERTRCTRSRQGA